MARRPVAPSPTPSRPKLTVHLADARRRLEERIKLGKEIQESFSATPVTRIDPLFPKRDVTTYKRDAEKWKEFNAALLKQTFNNDEIANDYDTATFGMTLNSGSNGDPHLFKDNVDQQIAKLVSILERLPIYAEPETQPPTARQEPRRDLSNVFVVHGHDDGAREAVARFLERLGIRPIILHEQASQGRTVIEKVEAHGEVGFAVILLTPDDVGCVKGGTPVPRARQNVVLELGYFIGRLGRKHVCALKRGEVEIPSDFGGVVYETYDEGSGWKQALGRELQAAGFEIDWNVVMRP